MRYLNNKDLMKIIRIIKKADLKNRLYEMDIPRDENGKIKEEDFGVMMIFEIIELAPEVEKDVFELLAGIAQVDVEVMENDEFELLPQVIEHLKKQENLSKYFTLAYKSI